MILDTQFMFIDVQIKDDADAPADFIFMLETQGNIQWQGRTISRNRKHNEGLAAHFITNFKNNIKKVSPSLA